MLPLCVSVYPIPSTKNMSVCVYPCPYGFWGDTQKPCTCAPAVATKYQKRISVPLFDHIDINIEVPRVNYEKLSVNRLGDRSTAILQRNQQPLYTPQTQFLPNHSTATYII